MYVRLQRQAAQANQKGEGRVHRILHMRSISCRLGHLPLRLPLCSNEQTTSMGLQPRPGRNANVHWVREFHATPAICMRHAAPLGSLRAAQAQRRAPSATRTYAEEATGAKCSCFVWAKDLRPHTVTNTPAFFLLRRSMRQRLSGVIPSP